MTKQQKIFLKEDNGWVSRIIYRKSMDDFVVTQYNIKQNVHKEIYLNGNTDDIIKFFKNIIRRK